MRAHEKIEHAISKIITNFTTKSALKKSFHKEKSVARLIQQLELLYLVPLGLITFRMCHEFGVNYRNRFIFLLIVLYH